MRKTKISRRKFLTSSMAMGGTALLASNPAGFLLGKKAYGSNSGGIQQNPNVTTVTETHQAVVIGSGFGGAVASLRLAQAGIETVVLERGQRWPITPAGNTFPTFNNPDKRISWLSNHVTFPDAPPATFNPYAGLIELVEGDGIKVVCGAGVGGSSLVYGAMMLKPSPELFQQVIPSEISYNELNSIYYPRVQSMIGFSPIPSDILSAPPYLSTRLFLQQAAEAGFNPTFINNAVNWDIVRKELNGTAVPSLTRGELIYGVNSGAKNSVDHNYLVQAESTPYVKIYPLHIVTLINTGNDPSGSEGYVIECSEIDVNGNVILNKIISCKYLFLAAGSMGTPRLLLKAKTLGSLPHLSETLGKFWGNNGDHLVDRFVNQDTLPFQGSPPSAVFFDWNNPSGPVTIEHVPAPIPIELHTMGLLGMGIPKALGQMGYNVKTDALQLTWPSIADQASSQAIMSTLNVLNQATGGSTLDLNGVNGGPVTYHPLGGAVLGQTCDYYGRVINYENLYVVDASLIPGSTGCVNPSWTVAAIAERCMDQIIAQDIVKG